MRLVHVVRAANLCGTEFARPVRRRVYIWGKNTQQRTRVADQRAGQGRATTTLAVRDANGPVVAGLEDLSRREIVLVFDSVSKAGVRDPRVWKPYTDRALAEIKSCSAEELCTILRALCRVGISKRSLLNAISRRLRTEAEGLSPRMMAQALSDLRKLRHLDGPLLLSLVGKAGGLAPLLSEFRTFDLPLLLNAFARASVRDEVRVGEIGRVLQTRRTEITPSVAATSFYSLALLDCGGDGTAAELAAAVLPRCLTDASRQELVNLAFALVVLDLPAAELLSFVLERLARRQHGAFHPKEVHALRIVEHCVTLFGALRPAMSASLAAEPESGIRCTQSLTRIMESAEGTVVDCPVISSKLQKRLERFFDRLDMPHRAEEMVGPYLVDYMLPQSIAVEVDGFKHFYAFSQRMTAKTELKLRVLKALGCSVVSLPHFEWLPRTQDDKLTYLKDLIEAAAGAPLATVRRQEVRDARSKQRHVHKVQAPARGMFGVRR